MRHAPNPLDDASTCISTVSTGLEHFNNGAFEIRVLISSKAFCSFASQMNAISFLSNVRSGSDWVDKSSENRER